MSINTLFLIVIIACSLALPKVNAQDLILEDNGKSIKLGKAELLIFCDTAHKHTINSIQQIAFQQADKDIPNLGYSPYAYWLRLNLENNEMQKQWILHYNWVYADTVELYTQSSQGDWQKISAGFGIPFYKRPLPYSTFCFPLSFSTGNKASFFLRITSSSPLAIDLSIDEANRQMIAQQQSDMLYGLYFGALIVMLLYNLMVWIILKDRSYLYYVFTIFTTLAIFSSITGYTFRFLWPDTPMLNLYFSKVAMGCIVITTSLFTNSFLNTAKYATGFKKAFRVIMFFALIGILHTLYDFRSSFTNNLLVIHTVLLLAAGIYCWKKGNRSARFYVMAWALYAAGGLLISLANLGIFEYNALAKNGVIIGSFCEVFLLSLALGDRYRLFKKEREKAQQKAIELERQSKELLEKEVSLRTKELAEKNSQLITYTNNLKLTNEQLDKQSNELRLLNNTKDSLFAIISHDLRSPINSLIGLLNLLKSDKISPSEFLKLSEKLKTGVENIYFTLNNLLHWANSQMNGLHAKPSDFNLKKAAVESIRLLETIASDKQIQILNEIPESLVVFADRNHINLVLRNLINNALKFTNNGGIIKLKAQQQGEKVTVAVTDNGVGIKASVKSKLFESTLVSTPGTLNEKGTGLGLTLCRTFIEKNNGQIWVESEPKIGSSFLFTLPVKKPESYPNPIPETSSFPH